MERRLHALTSQTGNKAWSFFWLIVLAAVPLLMFVGRDATFFQDDCWFFTTHVADPWPNMLRPHNEHLSVITTLVYSGLAAVFGTGSYLPYLAALLSAHVAAASAVYAALLRHGTVAAILGAVFLLFLGSGFENLVWAFQIGFIASVAAGAWALLLLERGRTGWGALLLGVSLASSGVGLAFMAAALVLAVVGRPPRPAWLALPSVAYAAWFMFIGRSAVRDVDWVATPAYIARSILEFASVVSGLGPTVANLAVPLVLVTVAWRVWRGWHPSALTLAGVAGFLTLLAVVGLVRAQFDVLPSRYMQPTYALLVLAIAGLPTLRIRGRWSRSQTGATAALYVFALFANVSMLADGAEYFAHDQRRCNPVTAEQPGSAVDGAAPSLLGTGLQSTGYVDETG